MWTDVSLFTLFQVKNNNVTRMYSSRIRTFRCSGRWGEVSAQGVSAQGGVSAWGVSAQEGCLPGGVSAQGGVSQHSLGRRVSVTVCALDTPPCGQNS